MTYQEAREKIKDIVVDCLAIGVANNSIAINGLAEQIVKTLLTPTQLQAWRDGGELVVTDPDQSLPHLINTESIYYRTQAFHDGVEAGQESMTGFRKVVAPQSEEVENE